MRLPKGIKVISFTDGTPKWDKQPGQTAEQHGYLTDYLQLGRGRRIKDLQESTKKSPNYLYQLSRAHRWREIAEAWDANEDAKWAVMMTEERRRAAREKLALSRHLAKLCVDALTRLSGADVTPQALASLAMTVVKIQAAVFDEPSRIEVTGAGGGPVAIQVDGESWDDLSVAERGQRAAEIAKETARRAKALADFYEDNDADR